MKTRNRWYVFLIVLASITLLLCCTYCLHQTTDYTELSARYQRRARTTRFFERATTSRCVKAKVVFVNSV